MADPAPVVTPLAYAGPYTRPPIPPAWRTGPRRVALFMWCLPQGAGTLTFLFALVDLRFNTRLTSGCVEFGGLTILVGAAMSVAGGIAVVVFVTTRWTAAGPDRGRTVIRPALLAAGLLASNYAVAAAFVFALRTRL